MILTWPYLIERYGVERAKLIMRIELKSPSSELHLALKNEYENKFTAAQKEVFPFEQYLNQRLKPFE